MSVKISVRNGVAYVDEAPAGINVVITDYDVDPLTSQKDESGEACSRWHVGRARDGSCPLTGQKCGVGGSGMTFVPYRHQRFASVMAALWGVIAYWTPVSWWLRRDNHPLLAKLWVTIASQCYGWSERAAGRL